MNKVEKAFVFKILVLPLHRNQSDKVMKDMKDMKDIIQVVRIEKLPSTVNGWGFSGSTKKVKHFLSNGDIVVTGLAHYRHMESKRWANLLPAKNNVGGIGESWNGSYYTKGVQEISSLNAYLKKVNSK